MRSVEGRDHLRADIDYFGQLDWRADDALAQRCAIDILTGDKVQRLCVAKFKNCQDIRLVERRSEFCFLFETLHPPFVGSDVSRQDLQSYGAVESRVLSQVNFTHSARAKFLDNAVMT